VFDATWSARGVRQAASLIARRIPWERAGHDRQQEGAVLHAMEHSPVPTPHVRWLDAKGTRLGRPAVIMDLVEGVCDGFVLNGSRPLERRLDIAQHLYDYLAEIHRFDWRAHGLDKVLEDRERAPQPPRSSTGSESCGRCNSNPNRNWKSCSPGCDHTRLGPDDHIGSRRFQSRQCAAAR